MAQQIFGQTNGIGHYYLRVNEDGSIQSVSQHADGTEGNLITGVQYKTGKYGIDATTNNLVSIMHEHNEIHEGDHYFLDNFVANIPINNYYGIQITTPNTDKLAHITFKLDPQNQTTWYLYEGVTINTPGTVATPMNNNRSSLNASGLTFGLIASASLAAANAATAVDSATLLSSGIIGSGRNAGAEERTSEIILKKNTSYLIRMLANTAGYVDYTIRWYEHTSLEVSP